MGREQAKGDRLDIFSVVVGTTGGYRIITARMEGVTATNAFHRQPTAPQYSKPFHSLESILRTGGLKTAARGKEGRNPVAIPVDTPEYDGFHGF